jgi:outer membrane protein assembly factor BamB
MNFGMTPLLFAFLVTMSACVAGYGATDVSKATAQRRGSLAAAHMADKAGIRSGLCAVLADEGGAVPLEMARSGRFLLHVLVSGEGRYAELQGVVDAAGLDPHRVIVEQGSWNRLPYADNVVDLILVPASTESLLQRLSAQEMLRVLRPEGKALFCIPADAGKATTAQSLKRWLSAQGVKDAKLNKDEAGICAVVTKPPLEGVDDWTHWEHGPDNNPVSTDAVIKAPYMTQWLGTPYYIAMPAITTAAGGRLFTAMGHIAHHRREEPWLNTILARNGYNGMELWTRKLPDGYLVHRSAFIATDDTFYMIDPDGPGCLMLDPETGREKGRIRLPEFQGSWKWIALDDGVLYALIGDEPDPPETTVVRSEYPAWSWGELSRGYYEARVPWGFGKTLAAVDVVGEKLLWSHREDTPMDSRAMVVGADSVFFYGPDSRAGRLNKKTGDVVWVNEDPQVRALVEESGRGLGSTPGFRSSTFCLYTPDVLLFEAQTNQNVVALSTEDGHFLWSRQKTTNNPNMLYADGRVLVGIGPEGNTLALDPLTGNTIEDLGFRKRSCVRLTATPDSFFCRGWPEGLTRYDRGAKKILFNGALRPACNDGVIGANGLLYIGPWLCDCNLSLMGTVSMCTAQDFPADAADRLQRNPEGPSRAADFDVSERDWPTYRGANTRTGNSQANLPDKADFVWRYQPPSPFTPTAPVAAGGLVFVCGDDRSVRALDAANGALQWSYATGGPILQPPTVWSGRAYVGSGDGYVYALDAATGRLVWRFRAAPAERRTMVYGSLCSTWPVNTGVLVEGGVAYVAAGNIDYDGTYVHALDAVTGDIIWTNDTSGHLDKELRKGVSAQGNLTLAEGRLWMAGGNVISPAAYDLKTGAYCGPAPGDGSPRAPRGEEIGVFAGHYVVLGGRLRYSGAENVVNPEHFFGLDVETGNAKAAVMPLCEGRTVPAWDAKGLVLVNGRKSRPAYYTAEALTAYVDKGKPDRLPAPAWTARTLQDHDVVSLALTPDAVLAVYESAVPRSLSSRWLLCALDRADGSLKWRSDLPAPALPGGLAVDRDGRVLVTAMDGSVACYGGVQAFEAQVAGIAEAVQKGTMNKAQAVQALEDLMRVVRSEDTRRLILARILECGGEPGRAAKKQGCIAAWRLLGPVPYSGTDPLNEVLVGEPKVNVDKPCKVGTTSFAWREFVSVESSGMVDLAWLLGDHESVVAYGYAEFELPAGKDLLLKVGSNDGFACWFNGKEAGRFNGGRSYAPEQDVLPVKGVRGRNRVLVKIMQLGGAWAFSVRVTDTNNKPIDLSGTR